MTFFKPLYTYLLIIAAVTSVLTLVQCGETSEDSKDTDADLPDSARVEKDAGDAGETGINSTYNMENDTEATDIEATDAEMTTALIIDDFEDSNSMPLVGNSWFVYDDTDNAGASSISISVDDSGDVIPDGEGYESTAAFSLSFLLDQGDWDYEPYIGWGVNMGAASSPFDASEYDGISYVYKGSAHLVLVQTFDVTDYDDYLVSVPAASDWTSVGLPFSHFAQSGWGTAVPLNLDNIRNIGWQIKGATGDAGEFIMDNVGLLGAGADPKPDLSINDPEPPEDEHIDSIAIDNPLQASALNSLNSLL